MKKLFLVLFVATLTLTTYSCRETTEENTEIEEVGDDLESDMEEAGDEIEQTGEEVEQEIEEETNETDDM